MAATTTQLARLLHQHGEFLARADETLGDPPYHLVYGVSTIPGWVGTRTRLIA